MDSGFRFQAYVTLKKRLGEYDAIVEFNEIASRELLRRTANASQESLVDISIKHGIRVDPNRILTNSVFTARRAQFYILSVYQQAEQFFDELLDDLPQGAQWKESKSTARRDNEAQLNWLLRVMKINQLPTPTDSFALLTEVFEYYRLVRNAFMHEGNETKQLVEKCKGLKKSSTQLLNMNMTPPNSYEELDFSDFLMFTRVVKLIASELCSLLKPDLMTLIEHCFCREHHGLKQYLGNEDRFHQASTTFLQRKFNLTSSEIQYLIPEIKKLILVASTR